MIESREPARIVSGVIHGGTAIRHCTGLLLHLAAAAPLAALVASLAGVWGCEKTAGPLPDNIPPVTYLSVQGPDLDTLGYRQILHWWGTDVDGEVVGYIIHWDGDWEPGPRTEPCPPGLPCPDASWAFTTATSDTFVIPIAGELAEWTFSVRAVDDRGATDPDGRSQVFPLHNGIPSLRWSPSLPLLQTSLPAVSFAWNPRDPDGVETIAEYRYWLDGMDSTLAFTTHDTLIALRQEDFAGRYGRRMIKVQAIDEARALSNVISHEWDVVEPRWRFMLIDNIGSSVPGHGSDGAFYSSMMDSLSGGSVFVYDFEARGGFRTPQVVEPLFSLFEGVAWYSGIENAANDRFCVEQLRTAESGIREYLDSGGRFLLISRTAIGDNEMGSNRGLSLDFARDYLGVEEFYNIMGDTDLDLLPLATVHLGSGLDSLRTTFASVGADYMIPADDIEPLAWVSPGFLDPDGNRGVTPDQSGNPAYLGLLSRRHGRCAVFTFLLSRTMPVPDRNRAVAAIFRRVLDSDE